MRSLIVGFILTIGLHAQVEPRKIVAMEYPPLAVQAGISGTVTFICTIRTDGSVQSALWKQGSAAPPILGEAAVGNVLRWRFAPSVSEAKVEVVYRFRLHDMGGRPEFEVELSPLLVMVSAPRRTP